MLRAIALSLLAPSHWTVPGTSLVAIEAYVSEPCLLYSFVDSANLLSTLVLDGIKVLSPSLRKHAGLNPYSELTSCDRLSLLSSVKWDQQRALVTSMKVHVDE